MTINNIYSLQRYFVVAGLSMKPADFVVSIRPVKYIEAKEMNM